MYQARAGRAGSDSKQVWHSSLETTQLRVVLGSEWKESSEEWLIPTLICDSLTLLSGEPKTGKTALACHIIRALITGQTIINCQPIEKDFRIGIMGFDSKWRREIQNRIPELLELVYFIDPINYKSTEEWDLLNNEVVRLNINYVVVDHLYGLGAGAELDRQYQVQEVLLPLHSLMNNAGVGILLIAHAPKGSNGRAGHSVATEGAARWLLRIKGFKKTRTLESLGNNGETQTRKIVLTPSTLKLTDSQDGSEKVGKNPDGQLPSRAIFILENCPEDIRNNVKAMGKWLSEQNQGISSPAAGRTAINHLITARLLSRNGPKGYITAGPKLVL